MTTKYHQIERKLEDDTFCLEKKKKKNYFLLISCCLQCKPLALIEEEHHDKCQVATNDLDLQGKTHHSICTLEQLEHFPFETHMDDRNQ